MIQKRWLLLPAAMFVLAACNDEEVTNAPDSAPTEQEGNNDVVTTSSDAPFNFAKFSLDVDYDGTTSVEIDYSNESTGVEASYKNDKTNETLTGNTAYHYLEPIFEDFSFNAASSQDEVIDEVIRAFNLDENFNELDMDITFDNGSEVEYMRQK